MANVPARIVTGYQGGWYSDIGNYLLVRQSDAHAWAEVWLAGKGWTRVDPTAAVSPLRIEQGSRRAFAAPRHMLDFDWVRSVRNGIDLAEQRWNDWIIEFNSQSQARMFSRFGLDYASPAVLMSVLFGALGIVVLLALPFLSRLIGRVERNPVAKAWRKFLRRLKRAGFHAPASKGAMELATAATVFLRGNVEEVYRIAVLYNRHRYSAVPPPAGELERAVKSFHPKKYRSG
jgi:protein-glutamine gamma-glutamyltransferase